MFNTSDTINSRYEVQGVCNDSGGMGSLLFVSDTTREFEEQLVLKYCRNISEEQTKRFRREVKLLSEYAGNEKVVQLIDFDLKHDPPYFVMEHYEEGDLTNIIAELCDNPEKQEQIFLEMIDCVSEIHSRDQYHRDIKPQNFLLNNGSVLVSDFGLGMEIESDTGFTRSSRYWGTPGYLPPEFLSHGGFKHADASGDIFMLSKSFYFLLTSRDPVYLVADDIDAPIFHVIERACTINKEHRYQTLAELKQSVVMAYDVILSRGGGLGETRQLISAINDRLEQEKKYKSSEVIEFIEKLSLLGKTDQIKICHEIEKGFYLALRQSPIIDHIPDFLSAYKVMIENEDYGWAYAETIADNMKILFTGEEVLIKQKAIALELAIDAAVRMNRFAAMDTCREMICNISDDFLGMEVASIILSNRHSFIENIEPSECNSEPIRNALNIINQESISV